MEYIFFLLWITSSIAIFVFGIKLIKSKITEKNKKGLKSIKEKLTNIFKSKEKQAKKSEFTGEQLKKLLIGSIITSFMSFFLFAVTVPPVEQTTNNNTVISESNNIDENVIEYTNTKQDGNIEENKTEDNTQQNEIKDFSEIKKEALANIPTYSNSPYVTINNNIPFYNDTDLTTTSYETYSNLDELGRCGLAIASIGKDIMPTEERGNIGNVKPTGWHSVKYQGIDGNYLYNRCHLIGYQLTAENANEKNLITGTRYMNVEGMLPFENMAADYIKETGNHVLYRVTPIFEGNNLLASGVLMEAKSVEDNGKGVQFNVYCYNVQPGVEIKYETGESSGPEFTGSQTSTNNSNKTTTTTEPKKEVEQQTNSNPTPVPVPTPEPEPKPTETTSQPTTNDVSTSYILNTNTRKFHYTSCGSAARISAKNRRDYNGSRADLIAQGYSPCGNCDP